MLIKISLATLIYILFIKMKGLICNLITSIKLIICFTFWIINLISRTQTYSYLLTVYHCIYKGYQKCIYLILKRTISYNSFINDTSIDTDILHHIQISEKKITDLRIEVEYSRTRFLTTVKFQCYPSKAIWCQSTSTDNII